MNCAGGICGDRITTIGRSLRRGGEQQCLILAWMSVGGAFDHLGWQLLCRVEISSTSYYAREQIGFKR